MAEPACSLGELVVSKPGGGWLGLAVRVWGGFDSGRSFLAPRLNRLWEGCSRPAQAAWGRKLVEPACERQRVGRVETISWVSGDLWFCPYARQVTVLQRCALPVLRLSICLP